LFAVVAMTLGDAFNRRKKLGADLQSWIGRISRTNQQARAEIEDLDGRARVLSIPELLVLKDDAIPKLEQAARAMPLRADDVSVYESGDDWGRYRLVKKVERKKESFSDKGLKVEEVELLGHDVVEVTARAGPAQSAVVGTEQAVTPKIWATTRPG
jgi:hypothetical protein